jgi:adenylyltransferase/sulfurtransferase
VIASYQATEAIKLLTGHKEAINKDLIYIDIWDNIHKHFKVARLREIVDCPVCKHRQFDWLEGKMGSQTTSLCGRNAVQVAHRTPTRLNFDSLGTELAKVGEVSYNRFMLKFAAEGFEFTVFPDGRAIIKGTNDVDRARTLYSKYIGH